MAYKLAISDLIGVKLEGTVQQESGEDKKYKFVLVCDRISQEEMKRVVSDPDGTAFAFFDEHAKDWRDQRLVLDEDDKPAPFSKEALKVLFGIAGMAAECWQAYRSQVMATAKN